MEEEVMWQSVAEYALEHGVSPTRVRQLASAGRIQARKSAGVWLIDNPKGTSARRSSRPLSARMSAGLIALLSGLPAPSALSTSEITRIRSYIDRLRKREDADVLISSWLHGRAERLSLHAPLHQIAPLLTDSHISPSGVCDSRINVKSRIKVEGYVSEENAAELITKYELAPSSSPNVIFHVARTSIPYPVPLALSVADLTEHHSTELRTPFHTLLSSALALADQSRQRTKQNIS
jgi:hypothetical protein